MPPKPMSIRTEVQPTLPIDGENARKEIAPMPSRPMHVRTGVQPILPTDGENALEEIAPIPSRPMSIRTEVETILPTDGENALGEISPMFIPGRRAQFLSNSSKFSFKKFLTYQGIIIKPIFYVKIENLVNRKYLSNSIVITQDNYGCIENQYLLRKNPKFKLGVSLSIVQEKVMHFKIRASYGVGRTVENKSVTTSFLYNL
jgi:hypothetical protein